MRQKAFDSSQAIIAFIEHGSSCKATLCLASLQALNQWRAGTSCEWYLELRAPAGLAADCPEPVEFQLMPPLAALGRALGAIAQHWLE